MRLRPTVLLVGALTEAACLHEGAGSVASTADPTSDAAPSTGDTPDSGDLPIPGDPTTTSTTGTTGDLPGSSTAPSSSSATSTGVPVCGDGVLDASETCDLGIDNADDGACTLACQAATCGDGLVWLGVEGCDFGLQNSPEYGGCAPDCQWAARCGDGALEVDHEQCDLGALNGTGKGIDGHAPCTDGCRWFGRVVFISSEPVTGQIFGLNGADARCQWLAAKAGLAGAETFRAWLSDGWLSPTNRFEQLDDVGVPYMLLDGRLVADDFADLVSKGPRTGITITEKGDALYETPVWTNTTPEGTLSDSNQHCIGWTSESQELLALTGLSGLAVEQGPAWQTWKAADQWTSYTAQKCYKARHLYCFHDGPIDGPRE